MSAELIGILSVGVALAALLLTNIKSLRDEMRMLREETRDEMRMLREETREDMRRMETRLDALEQRMARLEGVLDGLREALFGRSREAAG